MSSLVIVGGGPRATGVLLALAAALRDRPTRLDIHVIDPYPVGGGRIWRANQDRLLWMNSTAAEITVYAPADLSATAAASATAADNVNDSPPAGPVPVTGPDLASWIRTVTDRDTGRDTFIPRRDLSAYLSDAVERARAVLDGVPGVRMTVHQATATQLRTRTTPDGEGRRDVVLDDGSVLGADVVLLAQGHLDVESPAAGPGHQPPGFTADTDWSTLPAGEDVLVRGMGLAFIDLMMLVTEGRGGRFLTPAGSPPGTVPVYVPSGEEPVLWVGSGRGVPYRSKLTEGPLPVHLRYLPAASRFAGADGTVDGRTLGILLEADLAVAWYSALEEHHPGRTALHRDTLHRLVDAAVESGRSPTGDLEETVRRLVPDPADQFRPRLLDSPLTGQVFAGRADLEDTVAGIVRDNLTRATGRDHRQDGALYGAFVAAYMTLLSLAADGLVSDADRHSFLGDSVASSFSYTCSGPPPQRLANLLALHDAGIVRFLGPGVTVTAGTGGAGGFTASSPAVPGRVHARRLVDARLARFDAARVTDPLLRGLTDRGEVTTTRDGFLVDTLHRAVASDGTPDNDLFIVGPAASLNTPEAFGRPGGPTRVFEASARLAASLLDALGPGFSRRRAPEIRQAAGTAVG